MVICQSSVLKSANWLYITDASSLPESTIDAIRGVKVLVINALQLAPHHAHFNLDQAVAMAANIGAEKRISPT